MDLGRDVITKAITATDAERVFEPWSGKKYVKTFFTLFFHRWVTVQHYLVYSLVILGIPKYTREVENEVTRNSRSEATII